MNVKVCVAGKICSGKSTLANQIAEAYYNFFTKSSDASSAGISESTPSKYVHPVKYIIEAMKEEDIDISQKMVELVTKEMVDGADKIFVMCKKEECPDFLINSNKIVFWSVKDPFNTLTEETRKIRNEIKQKVKSNIGN